MKEQSRTFEQSVKRLEEIVQKMERGDVPLEEALRRVEAGEPYVIRQKIPAEGTTTFHDAIFGDITVENSTLDDQVLLKRDGLPTYLSLIHI